MYLFVIVNCR